jgi:hypothetical protein
MGIDAYRAVLVNPPVKVPDLVPQHALPFLALKRIRDDDGTHINLCARSS